jgi:hypothetical protein
LNRQLSSVKIRPLCKKLPNEAEWFRCSKMD